MAFRRPLYVNANNDLVEMNDTQINHHVTNAVYLFSNMPSVGLQPFLGPNELGRNFTFQDTRLQAGASSSSATAYPTEDTTAEPSIVTVSYLTLSWFVQDTYAVPNAHNRFFPVYYDASTGNIISMSQEDMDDTFLKPAIDQLVSSGYVYTISTTAPSGYSQLGSSPFFSDTRANTSLYTSDSIPETRDQPFTVTSFYLYKRNDINVSFDTSILPARINADINISTIPAFEWEDILQNSIRHAATSLSGHQIKYGMDTSGVTVGSAVTDTRLNGSGNYQTRFVNADDYRAQEFPNGVATVATSYNIRIRKE